MFAQGYILVLYPGKCSDQLFRRVFDDTININQGLVGVVDDAADMRISLSYSEEEGATSDKRFNVCIHLSEVFRKRFDEYGKQSSFTAHPGAVSYTHLTLPTKA